ncbi:MAG: DEAD/DEAH box helicase [Spirochaetales bacterium]|nr:DEAD/DEAH box helicase [Spirochaetales bacterium]
MTFELLGLNPEIQEAVAKKGYIKTTPIQEQAIPAVLKGKDVLGGAQTGTGKTAAFALPILNILSEKKSKGKNIRALVLTPTRELADQVGESFRDYGKFLELKTTKIYGGVTMNPQVTALKDGTDIVVATPGRLLDHVEQKTIDLSNVEILVLDEADRMLDMGFIKDIKKIVKTLPKTRQNLLFSATYGGDIKSLSEEILKDPVYVEVSKRNTAAEKVVQIIYNVEKSQKRHFLAHLMREESWYQVLVFVRTKHGANRLAKQFEKEGIPSSAIHSDKTQAARTKAMKDFKKGNLQALIATDVAARGIDLNDLSHVVNFELPQIPEDYVHRIGRTGRAGKSGTAITLVAPEDRSQLQRIEKILKYSIPSKPVKGFKPVYEPRDNNDKSAGKRGGTSGGNGKPRNGKPAYEPWKEYEKASDKKTTDQKDSSRPGAGKPRSGKPAFEPRQYNDKLSDKRTAGPSGSGRPGARKPESGKSGSGKPAFEPRKYNDKPSDRRTTGYGDSGKPGREPGKYNDKPSEKRTTGYGDSGKPGARKPESGRSGSGKPAFEPRKYNDRPSDKRTTGSSGSGRPGREPGKYNDKPSEKRTAGPSGSGRPGREPGKYNDKPSEKRTAGPSGSGRPGREPGKYNDKPSDKRTAGPSDSSRPGARKPGAAKAGSGKPFAGNTRKFSPKRRNK